ncbi:MAG TPA: nitrile hydratase subunit beta [Burkholderiales bacterium]|jgi:nitrile hydratase|nr:nitrile hydratase subunit beta [Burkholderiales bacterium]
MDGIHDLGGKQGFGRVEYLPGTQIYHHPWELKANALSAALVAAGLFNMDEYRHAIERMEPRHYLNASYYERVLTACAVLCVEKGVTTAEELARRAGGAFPLARPSAPGRHMRKDAAAFAVGERVRVRNEYVPGHVRMPGYIRGKVGVVIAESPAFPFPDAAAHQLGHDMEPTYDVRFSTEELWPDSAERASVTVAVFRSYLEKA